jgi:hypothetical protein
MASPTLAEPIFGPSSRPIVHSWDVFGTLLTRFVLDPIDVFRSLDAEQTDAGFLQRRLDAQAALDRLGAPYTLHDIYRQMAAMGLPRADLPDLDLPDLDLPDLLARELATERALLFPIRRNVERVAEGDIAVTDMYLPDDVISDLLRDLCGLAQIRPVVRSNWGKASGTIWPELLRHYVIRCHFGDNPHADLEVPGRYGIDAVLVHDAGFSAWEQMVGEMGMQHLALLLREARLRGVPADGEAFHALVAGPYLTLLFAFAAVLGGTFEADTTYTFLRRDCDDLARVFAAMFPARETRSLDLTRQMVHAGTFDDVLLRQIAPGTLMVDMVASGRSALTFFERHDLPVRGFATLLHLDGVLSEQEAAHQRASAESGRLICALSQSELHGNPWALECMLQTLCPPVVALGHDALSGGVVRSYGRNDMTAGEAALIRGKLELVAEFTACLRRRTPGPCDVATALRLVRKAVEAIAQDERVLPAFPSFVIRERTGAS